MEGLEDAGEQVFVELESATELFFNLRSFTIEVLAIDLCLSNIAV